MRQLTVKYLDELAAAEGKPTLLPPASDPYARAVARYHGDQVNRNVIPAFYRYRASKLSCMR